MCKKPFCLISFVLALCLAGICSADLVGWWRLDEGTGTTVLDSSSSGNNGTFTGSPRWVAGKVGGALEMDGGDYVSVPGVANINPEALTLMTWVNFTTVDTAAMERQDYLSRGDDYAFSLHEWNANGIIHGIVTSAGGWSVVGGKTVVDPETWYHTALTYSPETRNLILYLDGQVEGELSVPSGLEHRLGGPLTIGTYSGRDLLGKIDDIQIWDEAFSEAQIKGAIMGGGYPYAYGPDPADGAIHADTWVTLSWKAGDFAVSHDVYMGESSEDVNNATHESALFRGNQVSTYYVAGFPGFAYPDGLVPGTTYYWRIDEVNDAEPNSPWKGPVWSFSIPPRTAYNPSPADGAEAVGPDNVTLTWTAGFGAKLHHVYFGTNLDDVEAGAPGTYKWPAGVTRFVAGKLESEKVYYWRVDEFDGAATYKGEIWAFTTPGAVGKPQPANRATGVQMTTKLNWTAAANATSHKVYFGTDRDAVKNATTASPEYKGSKALGDETLDPGKLAWHTSYYWRVDAVYSTGEVKGIVWAFTTADFLLVDDFESYNDIDPPDPASNRIFDVWIDGFATPTTNGALVGNDMPPYAEQTIVHGGLQSMPYR